MNNCFLFAEISLQLALLTSRAEGSFYSRKLAKAPSSQSSYAPDSTVISTERSEWSDLW